VSEHAQAAQRRPRTPPGGAGQERGPFTPAVKAAQRTEESGMAWASPAVGGAASVRRGMSRLKAQSSDWTLALIPVAGRLVNNGNR